MAPSIDYTFKQDLKNVIDKIENMRIRTPSNSKFSELSEFFFSNCTIVPSVQEQLGMFPLYCTISKQATPSTLQQFSTMPGFHITTSDPIFIPIEPLPSHSIVEAMDLDDQIDSSSTPASLNNANNNGKINRRGFTNTGYVNNSPSAAPALCCDNDDEMVDVDVFEVTKLFQNLRLSSSLHSQQQQQSQYQS